MRVLVRDTRHGAEATIQTDSTGVDRIGERRREDGGGEGMRREKEREREGGERESERERERERERARERELDQET